MEGEACGLQLGPGWGRDAESTVLTAAPGRPGSWGGELAFPFVTTDQRSGMWQGLRAQLPLWHRWETEDRGGPTHVQITG